MWWNRVVLQTFSESDWIVNFRVSKDSFNFICSKLEPVIKRMDTRLRRAISVEHRVAITLWCLGTPCEYRTVGHLFGVARCTVCVIVHDTCKAIILAFSKEFLFFPSGAEQDQVIEGFKQKWGVIQCVGAIDGSHIPVSAPSGQHTDFYNRKGWYSIIIQAVVDHRYLFRDVYIGWPGSVHDSRVFAHSSLYKKAMEGKILNGESVTVQSQDITPYLIGDSAYPLLPWLMKPFPHNTALTPAQRNFNYRISRARIVVENAFGRLKARWRRLRKQNEMRVTNVPAVVLSCCILHNMCEVRREVFLESWLDQSTYTALEQPSSRATSVIQNSRAKLIRNALVQYFEELY